MSKKLIWFAAVFGAYLLYVAQFCLATGFRGFFELDWRVFPRLVLLLFPVFIYILWVRRDQMIALDYHAFYLPFAAWLFAFFFFGQDKGLMNAVVVEPSMVALLIGLYLLRFPLRSLVASEADTKIGSWLLASIVVCAALVARLVPPLPD